MFTRSGVYTAGERLTLAEAERLAQQEQARPDRWGKVRIVEVTSRTLRVLRDSGGEQERRHLDRLSIYRAL